MAETNLRSRQKITNKSSEKSSEPEIDKMFIKNRKQSSDNYDFGELQKIPPNVRDIMDKNFLRLFIWELYFGKKKNEV